MGQVVQSVASSAGLDTAGLQATPQIVGTPCTPGQSECGNNGLWTMTELNFSGNVSLLLAEVTNSSNFTCYDYTPLTVFVGAPHGGYSTNCRQNGPANSLQVNISATGNTAQMDIDPWNPDWLPPIGTLLHGVLQVGPNMMFGGDTNYSSVAGALGIPVSCGP